MKEDDNNIVKSTIPNLFLNPNYGRGRSLGNEVRAYCRASQNPGHFLRCKNANLQANIF